MPKGGLFVIVILALVTSALGCLVVFAVMMNG